MCELEVRDRLGARLPELERLEANGLGHVGQRQQRVVRGAFQRHGAERAVDPDAVRERVLREPQRAAALGPAHGRTA